MNIIYLFSFTWFSCLWLLSFCACCLLNYLSCSETFYAQEILLYRSCFSQWSCRSNSSCRVPSDRRYEFQFSDCTLNLIGTIMIYMTWCDYKFWSLEIMYVLPSWFSGLICDHGLTLGDLIGVLEDFFARLGTISYLTTWGTLTFWSCCYPKFWTVM